MTSEQYKQKLLSSVPTGKMVEPCEISGLVSYLCKEEANQITGITITIAGVVEEYLFRRSFYESENRISVWS